MAYNVTDTTVTLTDGVPFVAFDDAKIRRRVVSGVRIQFPPVARNAITCLETVFSTFQHFGTNYNVDPRVNLRNEEVIKTSKDT